MSNALYNKIKTIEGSRQDLKNVLNSKGLNTQGVESLGSLVGMVGQLEQPGYHIDPEEVWGGITRRDAPTDYYKGDDDWKDLIDLEEILSNDTANYKNKAIFLIRVSDCPAATITCSGYSTTSIGQTTCEFQGFPYIKFSDSTSITSISTGTSGTKHTWDTSKDIVAENGERFRYIIGYSNDSETVFNYWSTIVTFEAMYFHKGTFRPYIYGSGSGNNATYGYYKSTFGSPKYIKSSIDTTLNVYLGDRHKVWSYASGDRLRTVIFNGNITTYQYGGYNGFYGKNLEYFVYNGTSDADFYFLGISNERISTYVYIKTAKTLVVKYCDNMDIYCDSITSLGENQQNENIRYSLKTNGATSIAYNAFENCNDIQLDVGVIGSVGARAFKGFKHNKLKIEAINGSIGDNAFYDSCLNQDLVVLAGCTSIGNSCFANCNVVNLDLSKSSITTLPEGSNYELDEDSTNKSYYGAFRHNNSIQSISFPESLRTLPQYSLAYMKQLRQVTIPFGITSIGNYAFYGCNKLESIALPASITSFGTQVFAECKDLHTVVMPEGMTSVPSKMFEGCERLKNVALSSYTSSLGTECFAKCTALEHIVLPKGITTIPERCFSECSSLIEVACPEGEIRTIQSYAFAGCENLVAIPDISTVLTTGTAIFFDCKSLVIKCPKNITSADVNTFAGNNTYVDFSEYTNSNTTLTLRGSNWNLSNVLKFLYKLADLSGGAKKTLKMGTSYAMLARDTGFVSDAALYNRVTVSTDFTNNEQSVYSYYASKYIVETEDGLEWADEDTEGSLTVAEYVSTKNWTIS